MKPVQKFAALALLTAALSIPSLRAGTADFPGYGFSIDTLDAKVPAGQPVQAIMMFLPAEGGFASNVNVLIQPYAESIASYATLSKQQFVEMGAKVISERMVGDNEWQVEYAGPLQGKDLHWYARAIAKEGKVYLVTATAQEADWAKSGTALRSNVDSLKLK